MAGDGATAEREAQLHAAAKGDRAEEVQRLIGEGADIEARESSFGWGPLHVAAGSGACRALDALVDLRADVNAPANDGEVPLHLAAAEGHTDAIRRLAAAGAELERTNHDGETPLHVAVQHVTSKRGFGHLRLLLQLRADPAKKDAAGHDAFQVAALYTNSAQEVREVLGGAPPKRDPEDPYPEVPSELQDGQDPVEVAEALREIGNKRVREGRHEEAVKLYFKAKLFLPTGLAAHAPVAEGDAAGARARACYLALNSNAALCQLKLGEHDACIRLCDAVLELDEGNAKVCYRKGLALRALGSAAEAESVLKKALELDPGDAGIQKVLADMAQQKRREQHAEKRLAQKMFG